MSLTRGQFIGLTGSWALAAAGIYEHIDRLSGPPKRSAGTPPHLPEQHILQNLRIVRSDGVQVFAPPLHSTVVTAKLRVERTSAAISEARDMLERRLQLLDNRLPGTPSGLGLTVAWGLPYFAQYVPAQARDNLPVDLRASSVFGRRVGVLEAAIRFPSDPDELILEDNDVAFLLRSDVLEHIQEAATLLFSEETGFLRATSIRRGFAGGGFDGAQSLPKRMALAANIPGAHLIPDDAELFLGFTSTQKQMPGRERIANFETLGYTDVTPNGYFAKGTHMHLSHLFEDIDGLVPAIHAAAANRFGVPARAQARSGNADRQPRAESSRKRDRGRTRLPRARADRPQRIDPTSLPPPVRRSRPRRDTLRARHPDPAPSRLQHARPPVCVDCEPRP